VSVTVGGTGVSLGGGEVKVAVKVGEGISVLVGVAVALGGGVLDGVQV
jgi:hypothetical protein